jgi:phosphoglycerol transferase MdoB-like AlkP superfamily enzyme
MKKDHIKRREFLKAAAAGTASFLAGLHLTGCSTTRYSGSKHAGRKPNLVFLLADQWRSQAVGYAGNPDVITPNLDRLAEESINFSNAVSGCPVCCPYRASLMTGRYPLTHGVFLNDVRLNNDVVSIAQAYNKAGYDTAYIGKWHLDGDQRSAYIPRERRQGFKFWKALGCTHDYNNSFYYGDEDVKLKWEGYDGKVMMPSLRPRRPAGTSANRAGPLCFFFPGDLPIRPIIRLPSNIGSYSTAKN